jgi:hypothetical protein
MASNWLHRLSVRERKILAVRSGGRDGRKRTAGGRGIADPRVRKAYASHFPPVNPARLSTPL